MLECGLANYSQHFWYLATSFGVLACADLAIQKLLDNRHRWFKLHVLTNAITTVTSFPDAVGMLSNPLRDPDLNTSLIPPNMTLALHLYHMLVFNDLAPIDWIHHIVMTAVLLAAYMCPHPGNTNYMIFFVNGLPGGIDYFLLLLVKYGYLDRLTEKRINSKLNIYIRSPFIIIGAYMIYIQWYYQVIQYSIYSIMLVIAALFWNAQYFTERVVYNWGIST